MRDCRYTYCPVGWGTELVLQPAHPVSHAACGILSLPLGEREPAQSALRPTWAQERTPPGAMKPPKQARHLHVTQMWNPLNCSGIWTQDQTQIWLRNTDMKHKYSHMSSCCDGFIFLYKSYAILRKCSRSFKSYFAIYFMNLKWPIKVVKSWNHVMLVWLPDKLKSKR